MKVFLSKIQILLIALLLFVLSQIPIIVVVVMSRRGNSFGIAQKTTLPFILLSLIVAALCIFIGIKRGFYKGSFQTLEWKNILLIIALAIVSIFMQLYVRQFIFTHNLYDPAQITNQMNVNSLLSNLLTFGQFIGPCVLAPFFEESIYRASIYQLFGHKWWTFFISSFVFAYIHTGFSWLILGYLPYGFALTFAYHRRQVLTDSIFLHALIGFIITLSTINHLSINL